MKKKTTYIFLLILISITITGAQAMSLFGKKEGFRFEDYKTAEEAQAALLELHPVGEDYTNIVKSLENAGASCQLFNKNTAKVVSKLENKDHFIRCSYRQKNLILSYEWAVLIECNYGASPKTIREIKILKELVTL